MNGKRLSDKPTRGAVCQDTPDDKKGGSKLCELQGHVLLKCDRSFLMYIASAA